MTRSRSTMRAKTILLSSVVASFLAGTALPLHVGRVAKAGPYHDITDKRLLLVGKVTTAIEECYGANTKAFKPPITSGEIRNGGKEAYQHFISSGLSASEANDITQALFDLFITRNPSLPPGTAPETSLDWSPGNSHRWNIGYHGKESSATIDCYDVGTEGSRTVLLIMRESPHRPSSTAVRMR